MSSTNNLTVNNLNVSGNATLSANLITSGDGTFNNLTYGGTVTGPTANIITINNTTTNTTNTNVSNLLTLLSQYPLKFTNDGRTYKISALMLYTLFQESGASLATKAYVTERINSLAGDNPSVITNLQALADLIVSNGDIKTSIMSYLSSCPSLAGNNQMTGENTFTGSLTTFNNNIKVNGTINNYDIDQEFVKLDSDVTNINTSLTALNATTNLLTTQLNSKANILNPLFNNYVYVNNNAGGILPTVNNGYLAIGANVSNGNGEANFINNFTSVQTNTSPAFKFSKLNNANTKTDLLTINNNGDCILNGKLSSSDIITTGTSSLNTTLSNQTTTNNTMQSDIAANKTIISTYSMDNINKKITVNDIVLNGNSLNTTLTNQTTENILLQSQINDIDTITAAYGMDTTNKAIKATIFNKGLKINSDGNYMALINKNLINSTGGEYALYQGINGDTVLNSASGQALEFKINNVEGAKLDSNNNFVVDNNLTVSGNIISSTTSNLQTSINTINTSINTINDYLTDYEINTTNGHSLKTQSLTATVINNGLSVNSDGNYLALINKNLTNATGGDFALYQGVNGDTVLNSASGHPLEFKINNIEGARLDSNGDFVVDNSLTVAGGSINVTNGDITLSSGNIIGNKLSMSDTIWTSNLFTQSINNIIPFFIGAYFSNYNDQVISSGCTCYPTTASNSYNVTCAITGTKGILIPISDGVSTQSIRSISHAVSGGTVTTVYTWVVNVISGVGNPPCHIAFAIL